ncbi:MAG TPA: TrmH family RNA methyltransferase [Allosphingosinicella sp.]|nr:TrmH family RNA methyltransferase [Allosphingosinicella sp.]
MDFYAYLLRCADGHHYAGHTDDLDAGIAQHQAGAIPYTQKRRPVTLVWSGRFPERDQAFAAQRRIRGWSRARKEALIRGDEEALSALSKKPLLAGSPGSSAGSPAMQDEPVGAAPSAPPPAIVLVRPQLGENIGKAARGMLNFGLTDLRLVAPRDGWPNPTAGPAASGADVVLERARVFETVAEAVADCAHVYATTVRKRGLVIPVVSPEEAAREVHGNDGPSAFLFGAERSGLETEEVALAGKIVTVPVNPDFRSLNLAQAVILVAYEWSRHGGGLAVPTESETIEPRAVQAELEGLIGQLYAALEAADYFHPPDRTPATRNTIRTILTKAAWSSREVQALRGIVRALTESGRKSR